MQWQRACAKYAEAKEAPEQMRSRTVQGNYQGSVFQDRYADCGDDALLRATKVLEESRSHAAVSYGSCNSSASTRHHKGRGGNRRRGHRLAENCGNCSVHCNIYSTLCGSHRQQLGMITDSCPQPATKMTRNAAIKHTNPVLLLRICNLSFNQVGAVSNNCRCAGLGGNAGAA